jgi:hypothetical protein
MWDTKHTMEFEELKHKMSSAPVLALPDFTLPFKLETDASGSGVGAVLMQRGRPIAYYGQSLGPMAVV